ncbi:MAG: hypothetical protein WAL98_15785 [Desulfatiglandaceae bacterium]|jgi:hypothetical protein
MKLQLMKCPSQPGNLRISRHACALRHLEAQKIGKEVPLREFDIIRRIGLEICRTCPKGKSNASVLQVSRHEREESKEPIAVQD